MVSVCITVPRVSGTARGQSNYLVPRAAVCWFPIWLPVSRRRRRRDSRQRETHSGYSLAPLRGCAARRRAPPMAAGASASRRAAHAQPARRAARARRGRAARRARTRRWHSARADASCPVRARYLQRRFRGAPITTARRPVHVRGGSPAWRAAMACARHTRARRHVWHGAMATSIAGHGERRLALLL